MTNGNECFIWRMGILNGIGIGKGIGRDLVDLEDWAWGEVGRRSIRFKSEGREG